MTSRYSWSNSLSSASSPQDLFHLFQALDEPVDLLRQRVQVEADTARRCHAEPPHERLGAVMSGAGGDPLEVADLGDVVRVNALDVDRKDPSVPLRQRSVDR